MSVGVGVGRRVEGIAVAVRVGVADSKDEGATEGTNVAEGGAGEAEAGRVAMGVAVLPHPAMNTPTTITSRKREAIIRFMCHLLSSVSAQRGALAVGGLRTCPFEPCVPANPLHAGLGCLNWITVPLMQK